MDILDLIISYTGFKKTKTYRDIILNLSISQKVRYKTHNKKTFKGILIILKKYTFIFIRILLLNILSIFSKLKNYKNLNLKKDYDIAIIFPKNDNWVLSGISHDLASQLNQRGLNTLEIPSNKLKESYRAKKLLFIQHELALKLTYKNPSLLDKSCVYISHLRTISLSDVEQLCKFNFIFCQSSKDQMRLYTLGILPGRVIHLPIGFDQNLFFNKVDIKERKYDFLISTPLKIEALGSHYWHRKSSVLIEELILELSNRGYRILAIGKGWEKSLLRNNKSIKIVNPEYKNKNKYLNQCKVFLNLSLLEGGPVTVVEALASGCAVISKDNGLAVDLSLDFPKSFFIIPNIFNKIILAKYISKIFKKYTSNSFKIEREVLIKKYSFKFLSGIIHKNINI